jgi:hypothetical protein
MKKQYWIIDPDELSASGPFPTQAAAESAIKADIDNLWQDSCTCLTSNPAVPFCGPLHIVQVVRTVQPEITPIIKLITL